MSSPCASLKLPFSGKALQPKQPRHALHVPQFSTIVKKISNWPIIALVVYIWDYAETSVKEEMRSSWTKAVEDWTNAGVVGKEDGTKKCRLPSCGCGLPPKRCWPGFVSLFFLCLNVPFLLWGGYCCEYSWILKTVIRNPKEMLSTFQASS